ncbi:MAG: hypothetical protein HY602_03235 [Parcubacteria group bacterium]|nr:hypothetical protein [Parcubacteria group bacterium]
METPKDTDSNSKGLSRRGFLKLIPSAVGGAIAVAAGKDRADTYKGRLTPLKPLWEKIESGALIDQRSVSQIKEAIKQGYGVSIFDPPEPIAVLNLDQEITGLPKATSFEMLQRGQESVDIIPWDKPHLVVLERILGDLPPNLYNNIPPQVVLSRRHADQQEEATGEGNLTWGALCVCPQRSLIEGETPTIFLNELHAGMTFGGDYGVNLFYETVAHELSHIKTDRNPQLVNDIITSVGGREALVARAIELGLVNFDGENYSYKDTIGWMALHPEYELINYACGFFIHGKSGFSDLWEKVGKGILNLEQIEKLYKAVKENFYDGREYN